MKLNKKTTILSILTGAVILTSTLSVNKTTNNYVSSYYDVLLDDIVTEYELVEEKINYVPEGDYVPQGIALVDEYVLTSNFDYCKNENSVIYVIDKMGNVVNKCLLDHNSHVGGIAFDDNNRLLFVTANSGSVCAYDINDIIYNKCAVAKYNLGEVGEGLPNYMYPWVNSASFVTIHNNELLVGNFSLRGIGKVKRFKYNIVDDDIELEHVGSFKIPDMVQGIAFHTVNEKEYVLFSRSYGSDCPSVLQIFRYDETIKDYRDDKLVSTSLKLSPMLEQIVVSDEHIYALFESNSKIYTFRQNNDFDSIPVIDTNSLVKKLELKIDTN